MHTDANVHVQQAPGTHLCQQSSPVKTDFGKLYRTFMLAMLAVRRAVVSRGRRLSSAWTPQSFTGGGGVTSKGLRRRGFFMQVGERLREGTACSLCVSPFLPRLLHSPERAASVAVCWLSLSLSSSRLEQCAVCVVSLFSRSVALVSALSLAG